MTEQNETKQSVKELKPYEIRELKERFEEKIFHSPDGCWIWTGAVTKRGYGHIRTNSTMTRAHRVSYFLYKGEDPGDLFVCHTCDVPLCVNPQHLFADTGKGNSEDMVRKGRSCRGEKNPSAKLTEDDVRHLRSIPKRDKVKRLLFAKQHGISPKSLSQIINRRKWKHVA